MILGKPINLNFYISVDSEKAKILNEIGYIPVYRDKDNIYFVKTEDIVKVVKDKWNLQIK